MKSKEGTGTGGEEAAEEASVGFSTRWAAPEVLQGGRFDPEIDIYSFGMVLVELITHNIPFSELHFSLQVQDAVLRGERPSLPLLPQPSQSVPSAALLQLMKSCWAHEPSSRPSLPTIISVITEEFRLLDSQLLSSVVPES